MTSSTHRSRPRRHPCVFGDRVRGLVYAPRRAAYVIVRDGMGRIACERGPDGHLYPLGGGIDPGESPEQAVVREVREEADASPIRLRFLAALRETFQQWDGHGAWDQLAFYFTADLVGLPPVPPAQFVWASAASFDASCHYASARHLVRTLARA